MMGFVPNTRPRSTVNLFTAHLYFILLLKNAERAALTSFKNILLLGFYLGILTLIYHPTYSRDDRCTMIVKLKLYFHKVNIPIVL